MRPIGVDGPLVSIRKFSKKPFNLNKLVEIDAIKPQMAELLAAAVKARVTTIISGGTGSGKPPCSTLSPRLSRRRSA